MLIGIFSFQIAILIKFFYCYIKKINLLIFLNKNIHYIILILNLCFFLIHYYKIFKMILSILFKKVLILYIFPLFYK